MGIRSCDAVTDCPKGWLKHHSCLHRAGQVKVQRRLSKEVCEQATSLCTAVMTMGYTDQVGRLLHSRLQLLRDS